MHDDNSMSNVNAVFKYPGDDNKDQRLFFDLGYEQPISNNWTLYLNATHNQQETMWHVRTDLPVTLLNTADGQENLYEINLRGKIGDDANLIVGATHTKIEAEWDIGQENRSAKRNGMFAQVDYQFSAKQKLIAGFQINKPEESDSKVSSRLGFIQGFGSIWWLKINFAEAFRSPFIAELFLDAPALAGNPKLTPETIQTEVRPFSGVGLSRLSPYQNAWFETALNTLTRNGAYPSSSLTRWHSSQPESVPTLTEVTSTPPEGNILSYYPTLVQISFRVSG